MKILGVDTSTKFLILFAYDNGRIAEYNLELGRQHSSLLAPAIKRVIEASGWKPREINYFACGLGPGSFTGLRIGVAAIKGLAFGLNKPVLGVSTLDILALNADNDGIIIPAVDAKRNLLYCAVYKKHNREVKKISPYMLLSAQEFIKKAPKKSVILGDALAVYKEEFLRGIRGAGFLDKDYWFPRGRNIIYWALKQIEKKKINNSFKIKPIYLYPKECQIRAKNE